MWSFFSRDPAKDFAFDIGEPVKGLENRSFWRLHKGRRKGTTQDVSVFVCDAKDSPAQLELAKTAVKRLKTLRHPGVVTYIDSTETDKLVYLATEPVTPLEEWLENCSVTAKQRDLAISWGLLQITKALSFLINDGKLQHNNICMSSVFVDAAGEWKLGGLEYVSSEGAGSAPPQKAFPQLQVYDPPEWSDPSKQRLTTAWSNDTWGLGCLMFEVFNGQLMKKTALKSTAKLPQSLTPLYTDLVSGNPAGRPNPAEVVERGRKPGGFFHNNLIQSLLFVEEIQIKDAAEKSRFFSQLPGMLDQFPPDLAKNKILPQLITAFEFGGSGSGSTILAPMFKLGGLLSEEEYQRRMVPCLVKLFSSPDRATRVKLLQQLETFVDHLQPATVNDQIFSHVVTGFLDTSPALREHTVRASLLLAPKLNYNNLNVELLKYFARLQAKDDQGGIRTNTTVCMGKIAQYLHPSVRQKVLISAFLRATKDPFPPARVSGVLGLAATQQYYSLSDVASRVLPSLCPLTLDPDKEVRQHCFRTVRGFLGKLEKVSEDPSLREELEADINSQTPSAANSGSGWAGWAMGALTTVYKTTTQRAKAKPGTTENQESAGSSAAVGSANSAEPAKNKDAQSRQTPATQSFGGGAEDTPPADTGGAADGWDDDDDWGALEDTTPTLAPAPAPSAAPPTPSDGWDSAGWGGDEFSAVPTTADTKSAAEIRWADAGDDPFAAVPTKRLNQPKPAAPTSDVSAAWSADSADISAAAAGGGGGGWDDDWGDMGGGTGGTGGSAQDKKQAMQERRQQRQKELEAKRAAKKGPMKLGAKKL
ncbi:N-terminal kinase-like protein [Amphibalanus amphitrite]|uniref:N-terminal kinase-like protein n=1 Tax=Amphibalanus amphitrite TaxID=1232801 RepID=UPI001C9087B6|nr:N-terminal kinase-like protein [Amphibalanus amphitrite]